MHGFTEERHIVKTIGVSMLIVGHDSDTDQDAFWSPIVESRTRLQRITESKNSHEALVLEVVMDGTFLLLFRMYSSPHTLSALPSLESYGADVYSLRVPPSGLVLRSTDRIRVCESLSAGMYDVRVDWSVRWEAEHYEPLEPDAYPVGDGPDGIITFAPRP